MKHLNGNWIKTRTCQNQQHSCMLNKRHKYKELISNNVLSGKLHDECMLDQAVLPW